MILQLLQNLISGFNNSINPKGDSMEIVLTIIIIFLIGMAMEFSSNITDNIQINYMLKIGLVIFGTTVLHLMNIICVSNIQ
jgi:hypothetical protein